MKVTVEDGYSFTLFNENRAAGKHMEGSFKWCWQDDGGYIEEDHKKKKANVSKSDDELLLP